MICWFAYLQVELEAETLQFWSTHEHSKTREFQLPTPLASVRASISFFQKESRFWELKKNILIYTRKPARKRFKSTLIPLRRSPKRCSTFWGYIIPNRKSGSHRPTLTFWVSTRGIKTAIWDNRLKIDYIFPTVSDILTTFPLVASAGPCPAG